MTTRFSPRPSLRRRTFPESFAEIRWTKVWVTANSEEKKALVRERKKKIQIRFPKRSFWTSNMKKAEWGEKTAIDILLQSPNLISIPRGDSKITERTRKNHHKCNWTPKYKSIKGLLLLHYVHFSQDLQGKAPNEAPLPVVSWNFISTLKRTKEKKKKKKKKKEEISNKQRTTRHYFLRSALGNCTRCSSVSCMSEEGQSWRTQHPGSALRSSSVWHRQTSCPSTRGGGLQATSMLSLRGKVDEVQVRRSST